MSEALDRGLLERELLAGLTRALQAHLSVEGA